MQAVDCLIIFTCLLATYFAEKSSIGYQADTKFRGKTCKNKESAFNATNVPTSLTCSSICASNDECESFFYFPNSLRCDGCKQTYSADEELKGAGEQTVYYTSKIREIIDGQQLGGVSWYQENLTLSAKGEYKANGGYRYNGCFIEPCTSGQKCHYELGYGELTNANVALCFTKCDFLELSTIALQADFCYCGMYYNQTLTADCDIRCSGNPDEMCGGSHAMSVYSKY